MGPNRDDVDRLRLIDSNRAAGLRDVGLPGHSAAVAINPDGSESLWIIDDKQVGKEGANHGNTGPRHELNGRLPAYVRERIWGDSLLCGRRRPNGQACRQRVSDPGASCRRHRNSLS